MTTQAPALTHDAACHPELDSVVRLKEFRREYPLVVIGFTEVLGSRAWHAEIKRDGCPTVARTRYFLDQILDALYAILEPAVVSGWRGVAEVMLYRIAAGRYAGRVPPARAVAAEFGCSPKTAEKAYSFLAGGGLVRGYGRRGTWVQDGPGAAGGDPRVWVRIRDDVWARIESGELKPGDRVPSGLSAGYGCHRGCAAMALADLACAGIIGRGHPRQAYRVLPVPYQAVPAGVPPARVGVRQVIQVLEQRISLDMTPGDRLAPRAELARSAGASVVTVARAQKELAVRGLLRHGSDHCYYVTGPGEAVTLIRHVRVRLPGISGGVRAAMVRLARARAVCGLGCGRRRHA